MPKILNSKNVVSTEKITINVLSQFIGQIFIGAIGVVILKFMTSNLGLKSYGVYATIYAFVTIFSLLTEFGLNTITAREIAKFPEEAGRILGQNMGLRLVMSLVMLPVIFGLGFLFYPHASNELHFGILLLSIYLIFDSIQTVSLAYFSAKIRNDISTIISTSQQLLFLLFVAIISLLGGSIFGFLIAYILASFGGSAVAFITLRKHTNTHPIIHIQAWRYIFKISFAFGIIAVISTIYLKVDSVMLSILDGTTAVGIYTVAYSLVNVFAYLSGYLMNSLIPSLTTAKQNDAARIIQKAFYYMIIAACLLPVVSFAIRNNVVLLVSNKAFTTAATPFSILALATAFTYIIEVFSFASVALNKHSKLVYVAVGALVLNVCINFVLIPRYGIVGAAWATVLSEFTSLIFTYYIFRNQTKIFINFRVVIKPIIAACIVFIINSKLLFRLWESNNNLVSTFIAGISTTCFYFLILFFFDKNLTLEVRKYFVKLLSSLRNYESN